MQLGEEELEELTSVYNESLETGDIPDDWLDSHLSPVLKPEKDPSKIA